MLWAQFAICSLLILVFGSRLSGYANVISKKGIFSAGFMGVLFLAVITSCPEIFTSLGSITIVNAPNLAMGDLIGAIIINICVFAGLGILYKKRSILTGGSRTNILSGALAILMLGIVVGFISLRSITNLKLGIFNVGFDSIILGLIYIGGMGIIYKYEARIDNSLKKQSGNLYLWVKFLFSALVIIVCGLWLARIGKSIADAHGWNEMYIGLTLMAIATTMPELVVSIAALRLNSPEMAVGNIMGSNFFNVFIITILDVFFRKGEFLGYVSHSNIYPAILAILLLSTVVVFMLKRSRTC